MAGALLLALIAVTPGGAHRDWTARIAALLAVTAVGLKSEIVAAWRGVIAARFGVSFLVWAAVSSFTSDAPGAAVFGPLGGSTGLVHLAVLVGWCGLGRRVSSTRGIEAAVVAGGVVNAVAGLVQILGVEAPYVSAIITRVDGLTGNPVRLGALCAAGAGIVIWWFGWVAPALIAFLIALLSMGVQLSGSRAPLLLLIVAVVGSAVVQAVAHPSRRMRLVLALAATAAGLLIGAYLSETFAPVSSGGVGQGAASTSVLRSDISVETNSPRTIMWRTALDAVAERPVAGWGPGRFYRATAPIRPLEAARLELAPFLDAHNWPVEITTTTGIVGALLFAAWIVTSLRRARFTPLLAGAAVLGLALLVQPFFAPLSAIVGVAVGSAEQHGERRRPGLVDASLLILGVAAGVVLLSGMSALGRAITRDNEADYQRAERLLPEWSDVAGAGATIAVGRGNVDVALHRIDEAIDRDPGLATPRAFRGELLLAEGRHLQALEAFEQAVERDPWLPRGLVGAARAATALGRGEDAGMWCDHLHAIRPRARCPR